MVPEILTITVLSNQESIFYSEALRQYLINHHRVCSKYIGVSSSSKNMSDFVCEPLLIDRFATMYIIEVHQSFENNSSEADSRQSEILRRVQISYSSPDRKMDVFSSLKTDYKYYVYRQLLKTRKLYVLDGHKFGADFLAYEGKPHTCHAKYLVFIRLKTPQADWSELSQQKNLMQLSRLSGICKKIGLLITVEIETDSESFGALQYQELQTHRSKHQKEKQKNKLVQF